MLVIRTAENHLYLTGLSHEIGLASNERMDKVNQKIAGIDAIKKILHDISVEPNEINNWFDTISSSRITEKQKAEKILLRPMVELDELANTLPRLKETLQPYNKETIEQAAIQIKYDVYIEKERELVSRMSQLEDLEIPETFDYKRIASLGNEAREKLSKGKPRTLGQASRISGINPSDIQILMVFMGR